MTMRPRAYSQNFLQAGGNVVVGTSGAPTTVYSITWLSDTTAGKVILKDLNTSGAERWEATGTISAGKTVTFGQCGKFFPTGVFLTIDAHVVYADIDYVIENQA